MQYELRMADFFRDPLVPLAVLPASDLSEGLHHHEFAELAVIIAGQALHQTPFGEYPIRAGDIYFIPQGMVHGVRRIEGLALVNLLFVPERFLFPFTRLSCIPGFHTLFTLPPQADGQGEFVNKLRLDPLELVRVEGVLARIRQELDERQDGYALAAENLAAGLLIDLCRLKSVEGEASGIFYFRIARAISKLEQHLSEPIDLERAAGFAGMGARSFQRYFAQAMGCSFSNYLLGMRLRRAVALLRTSHVSIAEIGSACGFPDNNYFTRAFRKGMGVTPTEYRRRS